MMSFQPLQACSPPALGELDCPAWPDVVLESISTMVSSLSRRPSLTVAAQRMHETTYLLHLFFIRAIRPRGRLVGIHGGGVLWRVGKKETPAFRISSREDDENPKSAAKRAKAKT